MSKKAKIWTIFLSVAIITVITILSLCLCLIPIEYDSVTLKQLDTRVGKGCIVPKNTGSFENDGASIQFVYYNGLTGMRPPTFFGFEYNAINDFVRCEDGPPMSEDGPPLSENDIAELVYKETFVYKNKKPHKEGRYVVNGIGNYNKIGYNPQSIGYTMRLLKLNELHKEKVIVDIGVHKPSKTIRAYGGNVEFYTFGTKAEYKGTDIYYHYNERGVGMCFTKDQVVYTFGVKVNREFAPDQNLRTEAEEVLSLYIK